MHYKFPNLYLFTTSTHVYISHYNKQQTRTMHETICSNQGYKHVHHPVISMTAYFSIDHTNVEMEKNAETKILR